MKFVVDSSVWIDFLNGSVNDQTIFLDNKLSNSYILLGDLVKLEVLQGIREDDLFRKINGALNEFILVQMMSPNDAVKYAEMYRFLRKKASL